MGKEFTALEAKICVVTGKQYETGSLLLRKDLKKTFDGMHAVTGFGICPEEQSYIDDGYVIIVEIDLDKSGSAPYTPEKVYRTGQIARIRKHVAEQLFNMEIKNIMYAGSDVLEYLKSLTEKSKNNS